MSAPILLGVFNVVYLLALTAWVGSIAFFSFGVAPIIHRVLGPEAGGRFVRALFPRYYTWGATAGAIALPAIVCGPMTYPELRGPAVGVQAMLVLIGTLITLYCGSALTPAINAARVAGPDQAGRFKALHTRSVVLNGLVLLIGIGLLAFFAVRHVPRTGGIVERKPGELNEDVRRYLRESAEIEARQKAILEGTMPPPKGIDPKVLPRARP
ncbi:MAG: hypothetical protein JWN86_1504 [Planctomycetota bacterium]|nr:hypothetical protein [Planctomycetota bacterium]